MPILPRRFERLRQVLNQRMGDLTVVLESIHKTHNHSAILRSCDAVGVFEVHAVTQNEADLPTFNATARGSQKWVRVHLHERIEPLLRDLKDRGFRIYGTQLGPRTIPYDSCDFTAPTCFLLGSEGLGSSAAAQALVDHAITIPMMGMVQSLNVSVACATLLFEALRQRRVRGLVPMDRSGLGPEVYRRTLFEWAYPEVADWCRRQERDYPDLGENGEILEQLPRNVRLRC